MAKLLLFEKNDGSEDYVVIHLDESIPADEHAVLGFVLKKTADILGDVTYFPTDRALRTRKL